MNKLSVDTKAYFLQRLTDANTTIDFLDECQNTINQLGFSDVDIGLLEHGNNITPLLSTIPESLFEDYLSSGITDNDLTLDHLCNSSRPIFHSNLFSLIKKLDIKSKLFEINTTSYEIMSGHGYHDAYCIPINTSKIGRLVFSVSSMSESVCHFQSNVEQQRQIINEYAFIICNFLSSSNKLHNSIARESNPLTERQIEILNALSTWATSQKSLAEYYNISKKTMDNHVAAIRKTLGATSTMNAYRIALERKLIKIKG